MRSLDSPPVVPPSAVVWKLPEVQSDARPGSTSTGSPVSSPPRTMLAQQRVKYAFCDDLAEFDLQDRDVDESIVFCTFKLLAQPHAICR